MSLRRIAITVAEGLLLVIESYITWQDFCWIAWTPCLSWKLHWCELKLGKVATEWRGCLHYLWCGVLTFLERLAACSLFRLQFFEKLTSVVNSKHSSEPRPLPTQVFHRNYVVYKNVTHESLENLTTCMAAGRQRIDTCWGVRVVCWRISRGCEMCSSGGAPTPAVTSILIIWKLSTHS